jgi:hypothetical protein
VGKADGFGFSLAKKKHFKFNQRNGNVDEADFSFKECTCQ